MLGTRIKQYRQERQLSLSELASRAEVAKSYLSSIERNVKTNPSIQFLEKIASELDVSILTLLYGETDEEWIELARSAKEAGISKDWLRDYIQFEKWRQGKE
ncbi:helix-turn-helix domain-containing protein [Halobacillus litoralis]|uniref:XRE family transcriptional regulator n=1 Tax=Halobacillus litoralis TaxID=45668 RepID=UPI001CD3FEF5|nr:XRE family transcriptional regulator [Halobacillus litoralis]MCA0970991.1 helix-turn-helix domain-containing protein [Halobacillus litoralis]